MPVGSGDLLGIVGCQKLNTTQQSNRFCGGDKMCEC
jgi:hypothetical protein